VTPTFDGLLAEGEAVPTEGWDFSWFEGRATEERPPWGYARLMGARMATGSAGLDIQTGGGEVLASMPQAPPVLVATEGWPPNLTVAQANLRSVGGHVVQAAEFGGLPLRSETFDVVVSRHPVSAPWPEIGRVLRAGGTYLSQEIGPGSNRELTDFMMGPQPVSQSRTPARAAEEARAAGLTVVDLREASLRVEFFDLAAVVYFLRKVIWTVPDFSVERYRDRLAAMYEHIARHGSFVAHAQRFLIEAVKPAR
jgi:SAM-dependent methyltransferase